MSSKNTLIRSLHDLGLAAWFGGNLMGAVGLNGASAEARDRTERVTIASSGWARWFPVQLVALIAHGVGGVGLIIANRGRLATQSGGRWNTVVKLLLTGLALGSTAWSGLLGAKIAGAAVSDGDGGDGPTDPDSNTGHELAVNLRRQRVLQWVTPAVTAVLIVLAAQQGEQQRSPVARLLRR